MNSPGKYRDCGEGFWVLGFKSLPPPGFTPLPWPVQWVGGMDQVP